MFTFVKLLFLTGNGYLRHAAGLQDCVLSVVSSCCCCLLAPPPGLPAWSSSTLLCCFPLGWSSQEQFTTSVKFKLCQEGSPTEIKRLFLVNLLQCQFQAIVMGFKFSSSTNLSVLVYQDALLSNNARSTHTLHFEVFQTIQYSNKGFHTRLTSI